MTSTHTIEIAGGRLHYEVRGRGPLLLLLGAPMAGAYFVPLAQALADDYTVVTQDPRGIGRSRLDDPEQDSTPDLRADDVVTLLDELEADDADIFGSSGGAVTGLAVVTRYQSRVRTLIAHEPPLLELLPDAAERRAEINDIVLTFHQEGVVAASRKFMSSAGFQDENEAAPAPPPGEPSEQDLADGARFFAHELRGTTRYHPDLAALRAAPARIVIGLGAGSGNLVTYRTSMALAELLGSAPVEFPGDHGGFLQAPGPFAEVMRKVLVG